MVQDSPNSDSRSSVPQAAFVILQKPLTGDSCNRCGECCQMAPCPMATALEIPFNDGCTALEKEATGRTTCGLTTHPFRYIGSPSLRRLFFSGSNLERLVAHEVVAASARQDIGMIGVCDAYQPSDKAAGLTFETAMQRWKTAARSLGYDVVD